MHALHLMMRASYVVYTWKAYLFCQLKVYERGTFVVKIVLNKGKRFDLGAELPRIKHCRVPPGVGHAVCGTQ